MEEASLKARFSAFLQSPEGFSAEHSQQLLEHFPYSQVLWFLEAKRLRASDDQLENTVFQKAALFCREEEQLFLYLHRPRQKHTQEDAVSKLDQILGKTAIEALAPVAENLTGVQERPTETVSKYNDEHMPYTFMWWLHKTRMAYADTYQPYTKTKPNLKQKEGQVDQLILDQQIRENIFHLQSPEEKLSVKAQPQKTITFKISHKADELIDRFIREEPQIKPPQASKITLENKARKSAEDQSAFVSETLAHIYEEQGLYHKAIDAYLKLSLKYPEKSAYFADRIRSLESKIN